LSRMTTPLPDRCSPSASAVKASSGIEDCTVTMDLSARSRLKPGPPDLGRPACGSPPRDLSVIRLSFRCKGSSQNLVRQCAGGNSHICSRNWLGGYSPRRRPVQHFASSLVALTFVNFAARWLAYIINDCGAKCPIRVVRAVVRESRGRDERGRIVAANASRRFGLRDDGRGRD